MRTNFLSANQRSQLPEHRDKTRKALKKQLRFEPLEARLPLAFDVSLTGNAVQFNGSPSNDTLTLSITPTNLLQHNIPIGGNLVSSVDMDSATVGEQSIDINSIGSLQVFAGPGNDTVNASLLSIGILLSGGAGNDTLRGGSGNDVIRGDDGDDTLTGSAGSDSLVGGANNDLYVFDADSPLGSDTVVERSGGGTDTLDFSLTSNFRISLNLGSSATQTLNTNLSLALSPPIRLRMLLADRKPIRFWATRWPTELMAAVAMISSTGQLAMIF